MSFLQYLASIALILSSVHTLAADKEKTCAELHDNIGSYRYSHSVAIGNGMHECYEKPKEGEGAAIKFSVSYAAVQDAKSEPARKKNNQQMKADAGLIHGTDQYRGGQTLLTATLKMPNNETIKVAVPNEGAGWRPEQKEKAISLGYKPLDASTPGSKMHAEQELEVFRKERNASVVEWAISRGKGGNSTVCNEGCKNFTKNWGTQQK